MVPVQSPKELLGVWESTIDWEYLPDLRFHVDDKDNYKPSGKLTMYGRGKDGTEYSLTRDWGSGPALVKRIETFLDGLKASMSEGSNGTIKLGGYVDGTC